MVEMRDRRRLGSSPRSYRPPSSVLERVAPGDVARAVEPESHGHGVARADGLAPCARDAGSAQAWARADQRGPRASERNEANAGGGDWPVGPLCRRKRAGSWAARVAIRSWADLWRQGPGRFYSFSFFFIFLFSFLSFLNSILNSNLNSNPVPILPSNYIATLKLLTLKVYLYIYIFYKFYTLSPFFAIYFLSLSISIPNSQFRIQTSFQVFVIIIFFTSIIIVIILMHKQTKLPRMHKLFECLLLPIYFC
jgi:hypothetical protein